VIEMGDARRDKMAEAAASWAMDTLLSLGHAAEASHENSLEESPALQKLQALTFTTVGLPATASGDATSWLLPWLHEDDGGATLEPAAATEVLELCATTVERDDEFLNVAEAILAKIDCVTLGKAFLKRILCASEQGSSSPQGGSGTHTTTLFDELSLQSKVRIWGNHLPTWRRQLQQWLLAAHRQPFRSIGSIMAFQSPPVRKRRANKVGCVQEWAAAFQQYLHLYVTLVDWSHEHASLLGSCRSVELVGTLAVLTRPTESTSVFDRSVADADWAANAAFWTIRHRVQRFILLSEAVKRHEMECARLSPAESNRKTLTEWVGVAERPHLVLEAIEMLFHSEGDQASLLSDTSNASSLFTAATTGAALFLGWFYSHLASTRSSTSPAPEAPMADEVMSVAETIRRNLKSSDLEGGVRWLQSNRATFATLPVFHLRLVWFWLLKCIHNSLLDDGQSSDSILHREDGGERRRALVTGVLETIEYAFRRFAPTDRKRYADHQALIDESHRSFVD
jgi:hypothetical protein